MNTKSHPQRQEAQLPVPPATCKRLCDPCKSPKSSSPSGRQPSHPRQRGRSSCHVGCGTNESRKGGVHGDTLCVTPSVTQTTTQARSVQTDV